MANMTPTEQSLYQPLHEIEADIKRTDASIANGSRSIGGFILTQILGILLFFVTIFSFIVVEVNEEVVILYWGRYYKTLKTPGKLFII